PAGKASYDLGGGGDGITRGKARARRQCAFAAGVVAVQEMGAGHDPGSFSVHLGPPWFRQRVAEPLRLQLPWPPPAACIRRLRSRGSTCRTNRNRCTSPGGPCKECDIPWR